MRPRRPGGLLRPRVPIWFSARGPIHVYQMSDRHLLNAIRAVEDQRARAPKGSAVHNMLLTEVRRRMKQAWPACPFLGGKRSLVEAAALTDMGRSPTGRNRPQLELRNPGRRGWLW